MRCKICLTMLTSMTCLASAEVQYRLADVGLTGPGYVHPTTGWRSSYGHPIDQDTIIGSSRRYDTRSGDVIGEDAWLARPGGVSVRVNPIDGGFTASYGSRNGFVVEVRGDRVFGVSSFYDVLDVNRPVGRSWVLDRSTNQYTDVRLVDPSLGNFAWASQELRSVSPNGAWAVGVSDVGGAFAAPTSTGVGRRVGLSRTDGRWVEDGFIHNGFLINDAGQAAGQSRFFGTATWFYDPVTEQTTRIGLQLGGLAAEDQAIELGSDGVVLGGSSVRLANLGNVRRAWVYEPTVGLTLPLGMDIPPGQATGSASSVYGRSSDGRHIYGVDTYRPMQNGSGGRAWRYDRVTQTYTPMGLSFDVPGGLPVNSTIHWVWPRSVIGYSDIAEADYDQTVWRFDVETQQTRQISPSGLFGELDEAAFVVNQSVDERYVVGSITATFDPGDLPEVDRFGWLFDSLTGETMALDMPSGRTSLRYTVATGVDVLGNVFGEYLAVDDTFRGFRWSPTDGYSDLADLLSPADAAILALSPRPPVQYLGVAVVRTYVRDGNGAFDRTFVILPIPEPATLCALPVVLGLFSRSARHRRT